MPGRWNDLASTIFQNYGREQGLPPLVPTALAQDASGFLWIGTQGGLVRWDGYRFRTYDAQPAQADGLPGGWIHVLHTDRAGRLWIGTDADGLVGYDPDRDRFTKTDIGPAGRGRNHIGAIVDDGAGGLWVGTDDGLYHLGADNPGAPLRHGERDPGSLQGDKVQALLVDRGGRLWAGTDKGIARRDKGANGFSRLRLDSPHGAPISVSVLFEDGGGAIWIGTAQHGLYVVAPGGREARAFRATASGGEDLSSERVSAIIAAGAHELWVATRATGIRAIDTQNGTVRPIRHDRLVPSSLAHDVVWTMLRDGAGALWVGSDGGLSYHPRDGTVATVFGDTMRPNGITDPDISAILSAADGRIWLGFLTGGVDIIDPVSGRIAQLRPDPAHPDSALPRDVVTEMAQAASGDVYIATARGVYRADRDGRGAVLEHPDGRDPHAFARAVLVDGDTLWIGGPGGLWDGTHADFAGQLSDRNVFSLLRGTDSVLWIGTENGLDRLDLASGTVLPILADPSDTSMLPARLVSSLLFDRQGRLWVGTFGGGIAVMTGRDPAGRPRFRRIGTEAGLPHPNVDKLLLDGSGMVWVSTDDGLAVVDPANFQVHAIDRAASAPLTTFWVKSGATDRWGEPLFGAKGGLAVVRPGWPPSEGVPAPVVVSDIRIAGRPVPEGRFNGAAAQPPLVLAPDTNSLEVEFSALDFTEPSRNRYAYRLDGFDRNWIETDATRRLAVYTNLPPGDYVLRLRGSNRDGVWSRPERLIPLQVLAAWHQTLLAKLALAGAVMAIAFASMTAINRRHTGYLRRRQAVLEQQVAARTNDLLVANRRLSELATIDPLTGCANRRHFMERADALMAPGEDDAAISLAVMDLDHFKTVNDSFGHPVGDEVLRMTGRVYRAQIRATDLLGRIGGEEFAVLMPGTDAATALHIVERLRMALEDAEITTGDVAVRATASAGVAERRDGEDFDSLYARADAGLYAAKKGGRNRTVVVDAAPRSAADTGRV